MAEEATRLIDAQAEIRFIGEPKNEGKEGSAIVMPLISKVTVRCLSTDPVNTITVNLGQINSDLVKIKDLAIPDSAEILNHRPDDIVAYIASTSKDSEKENEEREKAEAEKKKEAEAAKRKEKKEDKKKNNTSNLLSETPESRAMMESALNEKKQQAAKKDAASDIPPPPQSSSPNQPLEAGSQEAGVKGGQIASKIEGAAKEVATEAAKQVAKQAVKRVWLWVMGWIAGAIAATSEFWVPILLGVMIIGMVFGITYNYWNNHKYNPVTYYLFLTTQPEKLIIDAVNDAIKSEYGGAATQAANNDDASAKAAAKANVGSGDIGSGSRVNQIQSQLFAP